MLRRCPRLFGAIGCKANAIIANHAKKEEKNKKLPSYQEERRKKIMFWGVSKAVGSGGWHRREVCHELIGEGTVFLRTGDASSPRSACSRFCVKSRAASLSVFGFLDENRKRLELLKLGSSLREILKPPDAVPPDGR